MTAMNARYRVGQAVEVQVIDFSTRGQPLVWRRGIVDHVEHDQESRLSDVFVLGEDGARLPTQRVGPRGGNAKIRTCAPH